MRKIILLILLINQALLFGQQQNMLPSFSPPSPEAFNMTKYGDVPIDEFNGKVKLDIPLYQFIAGNLKLPIAVNYYGAGVKVNDLPTQVGINWSLEAGGVITREIRDIADELGVRPDLSDANITSLNQLDCTPAAGELRTLIAGGNNYDTELDIFRFHFLNYSGSFYLIDSVAKMVKNDQNLKIEILGSLRTDKTFIITDPDGIQYYFGANACEETYTRTISANQQMGPGGITAFYLYKIIHPLDGLIMFEYDSLPNYAIDLNRSYSLTRYLWSYDIANCNGGFSDQSNGSITKNNIHGNKLLKRIFNFQGDEIIFSRTIVNNDSFKTYLNSIEVKKNNILFSKIDFEYVGLENPSTASRFFLTNVSINKNLPGVNDPNKKFEEYKMEYDDPETMPPRFSFKVDMLGYFNNKNNTTLIPCFQNQNGDYDGLCPDSNRTPDFAYASKGTLSKIYYPTGGFTKFEYEPQPGSRSGISSVGGTTYVNNSIGDLQGATRLHFEVPGTSVDENGVSQTYIMPVINEFVHITILCATSGNWQNQFASVILKITDLNTGFATTFNSGSFNPTYHFSNSHTYKIEFDMTPPPHPMDGYSANASFSFNFHAGFIPTAGAGVRVKRITNFANLDTPEAIKRYYYKAYNKLNSYNADLFSFLPRNATSGYYQACGLYPGIGILVNSQTVYSDYIYSDYNCSTVKYKEYAHVTVSYGGDDFEQGGIEKTFKISEETGYFEVAPLNTREIQPTQDDFPNSRNNSVSLDGLVLKEKIFKNSGGAIYKIKEKNYEYEYPLIETFNNLFAFCLFDLLTVGGDCTNANTLHNYFIGKYRVNSFDYKKVSEKETVYIDPVPATLVPHEYEEGENPTIIYPTQEELELPYKKVSTGQNYTYGTLKGFPTVITTNSSDGASRTTKNYYATDATTIGQLTAQQIAACNRLVEQNKVSTPIQVEQYRNSELLSRQRTTYKILPNNISVPELIKTSKANNLSVLEDRVVFEYNQQGLPVVVSLKNGMKTKYFYDQENKVRMKVENYSASNIPINPEWTDDCDFIAMYPATMITIYHYDPVTDQIISIVAPNCQTTYYEYDSFHRLKYIRDNDHNIMQEYNNNYKP